MRRLWLAILLCGCGGGVAGSAQIPFGLEMSAAIADQAAGFQVEIITQGKSLSCASLQQTCVHGNVPESQLLTLTDSSGKQVKAIYFPNQLSNGEQTVSIDGLSPGTDFDVVVEAVSQGDPASLLGSSCTYVPEIKSGQNPTLLAVIAPLNPPAACDPRFP